MATFTASLHNTGVKKLHAGANVVTSVLAVAATGTASTVFLLAKVPNGAVITDWVYYQADAGANNTVKLGLQLPEGLSGSWTVTESALMTETANTAGVNFRASNVKTPYKVSFTDTERFAWVIAVNTAAISASALGRFTIEYVVDQDSA